MCLGDNIMKNIKFLFLLVVLMQTVQCSSMVARNLVWKKSLDWYIKHEKSVNWTWCITGFIGFPATMYTAWNTQVVKKRLEEELCEERLARKKQEKDIVVLKEAVAKQEKDQSTKKWFFK